MSGSQNSSPGKNPKLPLSKLNIKPVTPTQAEDIIYWSYEPPYDVYNMLSSDSPPEQIVSYLLRPDTRCHAIMDKAGNLLAFCTFGQDARVPGGDYSADALDIGLGVHPKYTGKGYGSHFVGAVIDYAVNAYRPAQLRVTIADFNTRAQRVWSKQGFVPGQRFVATTWTKSAFTIYIRPI